MSYLTFDNQQHRFFVSMYEGVDSIPRLDPNDYDHQSYALAHMIMEVYIRRGEMGCGAGLTHCAEMINSLNATLRLRSEGHVCLPLRVRERLEEVLQTDWIHDIRIKDRFEEVLRAPMGWSRYWDATGLLVHSPLRNLWDRRVYDTESRFSTGLNDWLEDLKRYETF